MIPMLGSVLGGGGGGMSLDMGSEAKSEGFSNAENVFQTGAFSVGGNAGGGGMNDWMPVIVMVAALVAIGIVGRTFK